MGEARLGGGRGLRRKLPVLARPSQRRRSRGGGVSPAAAGLWACPFPAPRGDPPVASPLRGLPHSPSAQGQSAGLQVARGASTRVLGGVGAGNCLDRDPTLCPGGHFQKVVANAWEVAEYPTWEVERSCAGVGAAGPGQAH